MGHKFKYFTPFAQGMNIRLHHLNLCILCLHLLVGQHSKSMQNNTVCKKKNIYIYIGIDYRPSEKGSCKISDIGKNPTLCIPALPSGSCCWEACVCADVLFSLMAKNSSLVSSDLPSCFCFYLFNSPFLCPSQPGWMFPLFFPGLWTSTCHPLSWSLVAFSSIASLMQFSFLNFFI